jgi:membrane-associated phospholipid phosphatase
MDFITQIEVPIVLFLQSLGEWLKTPMLAFTFLGQEEFFMTLLPFLYWCVDARVGLQIAAITVFSNLGVSALKLIICMPRPFWVSADVQPWTAETSFGMPSGHATTAASIWGVLAVFLRKKWTTIIILIVIFMIGISRVFLGMHFLSQVLVGWLLGGLLLLIFLRVTPPIMRWFLKFPIAMQISLVFLGSILIICIYLAFYLPLVGWQAPAQWVELGSRPLEGDPFNPIELSSACTLAGTWFGGMAGAAWYYHRYGRLDTSGTYLQKTFRYLIGVAVLVLLWYGLGSIFPRTPSLDAYILRFLRYALLGLWMTVFAPWVFKKLGFMALAKKP